MGLGAEDLVRIESVLGAEDAAAAPSALKALFPKLSLTRADSSDMGVEEPFREFPAFTLYLVDGSDHCWKITTDPACATGLVLVTKKQGASS